MSGISQDGRKDTDGHNRVRGGSRVQPTSRPKVRYQISLTWRRIKVPARAKHRYGRRRKGNATDWNREKHVVHTVPDCGCRCQAIVLSLDLIAVARHQKAFRKNAPFTRSTIRTLRMERSGAISIFSSVYLLWHVVQGPFFVAFPNLKEALENNIPIRTKARSCTILPNFVGYEDSLYLVYCIIAHSSGL